MRIAVVSDIHANQPALDAVALEIQEARVDETWCLGDVVGYGGSPREALEWVEKNAAVVVKGNHDEAVATGDVEGFNPIAAAAARCHAQMLEPPERTRLHELPHEARPWPPALLVHGSPDDPLREYVYPGSAQVQISRWRGRAEIILLGHTHVPFVVEAGPGAAPGWRATGFAQRSFLRDDPAGAAAAASPPLALVNVGSVGQPRDGDPRAAFVLLDTQERTIELRRVAYDVDAAARAIHAARLDPFLAQRLYQGR